MFIQLIRSATLKITTAGHTFIVDPCLAAKHAMPSYAGVSPNPLVDLPFATEQVIEDCEMVVVSHNHSDHFDSTAQKLLSKSIPLICQPCDQVAITEMGFTQVIPVSESVVWEGIHITRTPGQHGQGQVLTLMGKVSGFVYEVDNEPVLYIPGDTIWTPEILGVLHKMKPDVIITHSGGAVWDNHGLILMDADQTIELCKAVPESVVIAVHMEALDHCTISRKLLREVADNHGISRDQLLIPGDGEIIHIGHPSVHMG